MSAAPGSPGGGASQLSQLQAAAAALRKAVVGGCSDCAAAAAAYCRQPADSGADWESRLAEVNAAVGSTPRTVAADFPDRKEVGQCGSAGDAASVAGSLASYQAELIEAVFNCSGNCVTFLPLGECASHAPAVGAFASVHLQRTALLPAPPQGPATAAEAPCVPTLLSSCRPGTAHCDGLGAAAGGGTASREACAARSGPASTCADARTGKLGLHTWGSKGGPSAKGLAGPPLARLSCLSSHGLLSVIKMSASGSQLAVTSRPPGLSLQRLRTELGLPTAVFCGGDFLYSFPQQFQSRCGCRPAARLPC